MLRVIEEVKPRFVVGENVFGLVNWNEGVVLEQVFSDLENLHYEVEAVIIPACGVNASHRRDRVWIVANTESIGRTRRHKQGGKTGEWKFSDISEVRTSFWGKYQGCNRERFIANTDSERRERGQKNSTGWEREQCKKQFERFYHNNNWQNLPKPGISRGDDGFSQRMDRTKAVGNAIVPEVAYQIFKSL